MPIFIDHVCKKVYVLDTSAETQMIVEELKARCNAFCALPSRLSKASWPWHAPISLRHTVRSMNVKQSLTTLARLARLHHLDIGDVINRFVRHLRMVNAALVDSARLV